MAIQHKEREVLARNVRRLMAEREWSQQDLANRAKIAQKTVSHILRQETAASIDTLAGIAKAFQVDIWTLMLEQAIETMNERSTKLSKIVRKLQDAKSVEREALITLIEKLGK
jgi:transcriptional regulator with XRE-family HTH domain